MSLRFQNSLCALFVPEFSFGNYPDHFTKTMSTCPLYCEKYSDSVFFWQQQAVAVRSRPVSLGGGGQAGARKCQRDTFNPDKQSEKCCVQKNCGLNNNKVHSTSKRCYSGFFCLVYFAL